MLLWEVETAEMSHQLTALDWAATLAIVEDQFKFHRLCGFTVEDVL
jgi:hypothetical protein